LLKKSWELTKSFVSSIYADIIMLMISTLVSSFINKLDFWNLRTYFNINENMTFIIYALFIYILLFLLVLLFHLVEVNIEQEKYKAITRLSLLRTEGVEIRNLIMKDFKFATEIELENVINQYNDWHDRIMKIYLNVNPARAEIWNTLDKFPIKYFDSSYGKITAHSLNMIDEKIKRLTNDISDMLNKIDK